MPFVLPPRPASSADPSVQKRLAELSAGGGGGGGNTPTFPRGAAPGGGGGGAGGEDAAQKRAQEAEGRRTIMSQILSPEARERRTSHARLSDGCRG